MNFYGRNNLTEMWKKEKNRNYTNRPLLSCFFCLFVLFLFIFLCKRVHGDIEGSDCVGAFSIGLCVRACVCMGVYSFMFILFYVFEHTEQTPLHFSNVAAQGRYALAQKTQHFATLSVMSHRQKLAF